MIKKLLALLFVASACYAESVGIASFKYLNTNQNSTIIDQNGAQDLRNVDVTPGGKSIKKRPGFGLYKTVFSQSTGVHGGYHGYDSTGNDIQVWASSISVKAIVADGTPATIVSSMTLNSTLDCADTQGSVYCVDSSRDFYIRTNGASLTSWQTSPLGTMIESTPDRVVVAGVNGSPNTLFISGSNAFTTYTVGPLTTDPFNEVIGAPGSRITHIRWGCQRLLWWKDQSFGYFNFDDQYSGQIKVVSDIIGTYDNTSAIDPGGSVWFRGQDGHIYQYNCSGLIKQTIEITPQIQASGHRAANTWRQASASDFATGDQTSTTTYSSALGGVTISTNNADTPDNSFESDSWTRVLNWQRYNLSIPSTFCSGAKSGSWYTYYSQASHWTGGITVTANDAVTDAVIVSTNLAFTDHDCAWEQATLTVGGAYTKRYVKLKAFNPATPSDVMSSPAFTMSGQDITFWYGMEQPTGSPATELFTMDLFQGGQTTMTNGVYYSAVHNANNLTSWNSFAATIGSDGTQAFFTRSSTSSFTTLSSTPTWVSQTVGSVVAASTGTFFQMKDSFTVTAASQTPSLQNFAFNWIEGSAGDQAYMLYFDNAIWASMTYGVGVSTNNFIFRRDLVNDGWGLYDFGANGMLVQNNTLYFGSPTDGSVYQFGSGTSDNGTAINAYWKSKDFTAIDPFTQSQLNQADVFAKQNTGQTLTATYTTDTSTSTSYTINLSLPTQGFIQSRKLLPSGKTGYAFNFKLSDNTTTSAWEVFGFRLTYTTLPWKPTP